MEAVARARMIRKAPRKMRLVADLIRGQKVAAARDILDVTVKDAAGLIRKVLDAAVANAEEQVAETRRRLDTDEFVIKKVTVDGGPTMKRFQPSMRGRALRIRKRTSHIELVISDS